MNEIVSNGCIATFPNSFSTVNSDCAEKACSLHVGWAVVTSQGKQRAKSMPGQVPALYSRRMIRWRLGSERSTVHIRYQTVFFFFFAPL